MGQKVHPYVLRLGFAKTWQSRWFADRKGDFADYLEEDVKIRKIVKSSYQAGTISDVQIERVSGSKIRLRLSTSRPGVVIGRKGQDIENLKAAVQKLSKKEIVVDVVEIAQPALDAQLVAELIGFQLIKRVAFRKAMKKALFQAKQEGCEGIKIKVSGRLGGAEIARTEGYKEGKVPLQTLKSDIDYGYYVAQTTYGTLGIKVWIYKGDVKLGKYMEALNQDKRPAQKQNAQ